MIFVWSRIRRIRTNGNKYELHELEQMALIVDCKQLLFDHGLDELEWMALIVD